MCRAPEDTKGGVLWAFLIHLSYLSRTWTHLPAYPSSPEWALLIHLAPNMKSGPVRAELKTQETMLLASPSQQHCCYLAEHWDFLLAASHPLGRNIERLVTTYIYSLLSVLTEGQGGDVTCPAWSADMLEQGQEEAWVGSRLQEGATETLILLLHRFWYFCLSEPWI